MNYQSIINGLRREVVALDQAIAALEAFATAGPPPVRVKPTRGRKPNMMTAEERAAVSERMKRHWASRRKARGTSQRPR